jgi:protein-L-isoaspartate(D-aspartate) O-methyltransferase
MNFLKEEKKNLIKILRTRGIRDQNILDAFYKVPREKFIPEALRKFAYDDNALPIAHGQTISQPYTVAIMTLASQIRKGNKVLEVGTGSGYQAAILCELGAEVYSIERIAELYESAEKLLSDSGYKVKLKIDDGSLGWEEYSPFDNIIVTAAAPSPPKSLINQLNINGKLVVPVGTLDSQTLYIVKKTQGGTEVNTIDSFRFVPLIGMEGWKDI